MKRSFLCGLLLVSSIMLGSLFVDSFDVSALKYNIDYIPFTVPTTPENNGITLYQPFQIDIRGISQNMAQDNGIHLKSSDYYYFNASPRNDNPHICDYTNYYSVELSPSDSSYAGYSIPYYLQPTDDSMSVNDVFNLGPFYLCYPDNEFGFDTITDFNSMSLPSYTFGTPDLRSYLPYRYDHNGAYLHGTYTEDGLNRQTRFNFTDLAQSGHPLDGYAYEVTIPIGLSTLEFPAGTPLTFEGEMMFDSSTGEEELYVNPNGTVTLYATYLKDYASYMSHLTPSNVFRSQAVSCSFEKVANTNSDEYPWSIKYSCSTTVPIDASLSGFYLQFRGTQNSSQILPFFSISYLRDWVYVNSTVITDNDSTPTNDSFQYFEMHGNIRNAPGYAGPVEDVVLGDINFSETLRNLFNFHFINPFQELFELFDSGENCANIPTLASMLNSNETRVCPWFPASVRNIVTPVLGISSMMLVFGFAVRWLGARSGNLFEDSVETDNYSFSNKFRRSKK